MNSIRTNHTELRNTTVNGDEWEGILGRLDILTDEIARKLGRSSPIESYRRAIRMARPSRDDQVERLS